MTSSIKNHYSRLQLFYIFVGGNCPWIGGKLVVESNMKKDN